MHLTCKDMKNLLKAEGGIRKAERRTGSVSKSRVKSENSVYLHSISLHDETFIVDILYSSISFFLQYGEKRIATGFAVVLRQSGDPLGGDASLGKWKNRNDDRWRN